MRRMIQDRKSRLRSAAENASADAVTGFKFVRRRFISMHWPARENAISIFRSRSFSSFQEAGDAGDKPRQEESANARRNLVHGKWMKCGRYRRKETEERGMR